MAYILLKQSQIITEMSKNQEKDQKLDKEVLDQEQVVEETNEAQEEKTAKEESKSEAKDEEKEPTIEEQLQETKNKFLRLYADFENFRKRTNKEKVDLMSTASAGVVKDMLPVLDDFERAIANNEKVDDAEALKEGFALIYNKFKSVLDSKGLKKMETVGSEFDSEIHEAVANMPVEDKKQKGKVIDDVEKGYYLNDKVIRFAKVVVGQ